MLYKTEFCEFIEDKNKVQVFFRDNDFHEEGMTILGDYHHEEGMVAEYEVISGDAKSSAISFAKLSEEGPHMIGLDFADLLAIMKDCKIGSYHFVQGWEALEKLLEELLSKGDNYDIVLILVEGAAGLIAAHEAACFVDEMLGEEASILFQLSYIETLGDTIHYHLWFF